MGPSFDGAAKEWNSAPPPVCNFVFHWKSKIFPEGGKGKRTRKGCVIPTCS